VALLYISVSISGSFYSVIIQVARSRLTHFKFEYCAGAIACRGWPEEER